jgi:hypothetical protein
MTGVLTYIAAPQLRHRRTHRLAPPRRLVSRRVAAHHVLLAGALDGSLSRVDRNAAAMFQDYLNVARADLPPHRHYQDLKRDGWIGPKTTDAFKTALYSLGAKNLADDLEGVFGA